MLKYGEKVVKTLTNILMIIVVISIFFALYSFIVLNIMGKSYVNFFSYTIFDVVSGSMDPAILKDDTILVKITDDVKVGDVITYKLKDDFITHRIIKMEKDVIITQGDANNTPDNPIDKSIVIGKVVKVFKKVGVWKKVLLTPKVLISILVTLFLFSFAFSISLKNKNKDNNKSDKIIKKEEIPKVIETKNNDDIEIL